MSKKFFKNIRINPITGEPDYFFPMEIMDPADKEYARLNGLEVGQAMLGCRTFEAIMVPCKNKTTDAQGRDIYLDTPSEEQQRIYKAYTQDELDRQEEERMDGRCLLQPQPPSECNLMRHSRQKQQQNHPAEPSPSLELGETIKPLPAAAFIILSWGVK